MKKELKRQLTLSTFLILIIGQYVKSECSEGCLLCKNVNGGECQLCDSFNNYVMDPDTKKKCIFVCYNNCLAYDSVGNCAYCSDGFYIEPTSGVCTKVPDTKIVLNCLYYDKLAKCEQCKKHHYLINNTCMPVLNKIEYCDIYLENYPSFCQQCESGKRLSKDHRICVKKPSPLTCLYYSSVSCTKCDDSYIKLPSQYITHFSDIKYNYYRNQFLMFVQEKLTKNISSCVKTNVQNCEIYENKTKCKTCKKGFILTLDKRCVIYPSNGITNCEIYDTITKCRQCSQGYMPDSNGQCKSVTIIENCELYSTTETDGTTKCTGCISSYYLKQGANRCIRRIQIVEDCEVRSVIADQCEKCLTSKNLKITTDGLRCLPIIENCSEYMTSNRDSIQHSCQTCIDYYTYYPSKNECLKGTVEFCVVYSKSNQCTQCKNGYYVVNKNCVPQTPISECLTYSSEITGQCTKCSISSLLFSQTNTCAKYNIIPKCAEYLDPDHCLKCVTSYYLSDNKCIKISPLLNCLEWSGGKCTQCSDIFFLENGVCVTPYYFLTSSGSTSFCPNNNIDGLISMQQYRCLGCHSQTSLPLNLINYYLCYETLTQTNIENCLKYSVTSLNQYQCQQCGNGMFLNQDKCTNDCVGGSRIHYVSLFEKTIASISGASFAYNFTGTKRCELMPEDSSNIANTFDNCALIGPSSINSNESNQVQPFYNNVCISCLNDYLPVIGDNSKFYLETGQTSVYKLFATASALSYGSSDPQMKTPLDAFPVFSCQSIVTPIDKCEYYFTYDSSTSDKYRCFKCQIGYAVQVPSGQSDLNSSSCQLITGCDPSISFAGSTWSIQLTVLARMPLSAYLSCYKCTQQDTYPVTFIRFDDKVKHNFSPNTQSGGLRGTLFPNSSSFSLPVCKFTCEYQKLDDTSNSLSSCQQLCNCSDLDNDNCSYTPFTSSKNNQCLEKNCCKCVQQSSSTFLKYKLVSQDFDCTFNSELKQQTITQCLKIEKDSFIRTLSDVQTENNSKSVSAQCRDLFLSYQINRFTGFGHIPHCNNYFANIIQEPAMDKSVDFETILANYSIYCVACDPGYRPINTTTRSYLAPHMIIECAAISNCDLSASQNWLNACEKCLSNFVYEYDPSTFTIYYDRCVSIGELSNLKCFAVQVVNGTTTCVQCQLGFFLNEDNICDKIVIPNCDDEVSSFIQNQGSINYISDYRYWYFGRQLIFFSHKPTSCNKCKTNYIAIKNVYEIRICIESEYLQDQTAFIQNSNFPQNCNSYMINTSFKYVCAQCKDGFIVSHTGQCYERNNNGFDNCTVAKSESTCYECSAQYVLVNNLCQKQNIVNCQIYDNSENSTFQKCTLCLDGYYSTVTECRLGAIKNCRTYSSETVCQKCQEGYQIATLTKSLSYCFKIPPSLHCLTYENSFQNRNLFCEQCGEGYIPSKTGDFTSSYCMPFNVIDNCTLYNTLNGSSISDISFDCIQCQIDYYVKNNACTQRLYMDPFCTIYHVSDDICLQCANDYYISDDYRKCHPKPTGISFCQQYDINTICTLCIEGYFLNNNACIALKKDEEVDNCAFYSAPLKCLSCQSAFYLTADNECKPTTALNCLIALDENNCKTCPPNYGFINTKGSLSCIKNFDTHCLEFTQTYPFNCLTCAEGYYPLSGNYCQFANDAIKGCLFYDSKEKCRLCKATSVLSISGRFCSGDKYIQGEIDDNCASSQMLMEPQCKYCQVNYFLNDKGECVKCSDQNIGCWLCDPSDPLVCFICQSGYVQKADGTCAKNLNFKTLLERCEVLKNESNTPANDDSTSDNSSTQAAGIFQQEYQFSYTTLLYLHFAFVLFSAMFI